MSESIEKLLSRHAKNDPTLVDVKSLDLRSATTVTGGSSKSKTAALNQISALLPSLSGLQSLSLSGMGIGPRGIKLVLGILSNNNSNCSGSGSCCPQLTELNISGCRIGFFGAKEISSIGLPLTLTRLDVSNNELETEGIWQIKSALEPLQLLKYISLSYNNLGDDATSEIGRLLPTLQSIVEIDLSSNNIQDNGALSIGMALSNSNCNLEKLNISKNKIADDGARYILDGIANNTTLTSLNLSSNSITDIGGGEFVDQLDNTNRTLLHLDLSGNQISESRMRVLAILLKHRNKSSVAASLNKATDSNTEPKIEGDKSSSVLDRMVEKALQIKESMRKLENNSNSTDMDTELEEVLAKMDAILLKLQTSN